VNIYSLEAQQRAASTYSAAVRELTARNALSTPAFERSLEHALQAVLGAPNNQNGTRHV
jgi:hypothetical protein